MKKKWSVLKTTRNFWLETCLIKRVHLFKHRVLLVVISPRIYVLFNIAARDHPSFCTRTTQPLFWSESELLRIWLKPKVRGIAVFRNSNVPTKTSKRFCFFMRLIVQEYSDYLILLLFFFNSLIFLLENNVLKSVIMVLQRKIAIYQLLFC